MINWIEKGYGLRGAIREAGYWIESNDSVWSSSDDVAVQVIIDNYDPFPDSKSKTIARLKIEASKRAALIYEFIDPTTKQAVGLYNFTLDLYLTTIPEARTGLSGRLLAFKNVHDAAILAIADINEMTDWQLIDAYDVVNTPVWP